MKQSNVPEVIVIDNNLICFVTVDQKTNINEDVIQTHARQNLPFYMQPREYIFVTDIPLTVNGKLDSKKLVKQYLKLDNISATPLTDVTPPSALENRILTIWKNIFPDSVLSVNSDFFQIGGDSLNVLSIVSALRKQGIDIKPSQLYSTSTIKGLANFIESQSDMINDSNHTLDNIETQSLKLPILGWFFNLPHKNINHFNQSLRFGCNKEINLDVLFQAFNLVTKNHLIFQAYITKSTPSAVYFSKEPQPIEIVVVEQNSNTNKKLDELEKSLDITTGKLLICCVIEGNNHAHELVLIAHHLLVDGVSWNIILDDLEHAYSAIENGEKINLSKEKTNIVTWSNYLQSYSRSKYCQHQIPYWINVINNAARNLPIETNMDESSYCKHSHILTAAKTHQFINFLEKHSINLETGSIYLLANAFFTILPGEFGINLMLERHGREILNNNIDLSHTCGWFTSMFPIHIPAPDENLLTSINESLKNIPDNGLSYGVLKYLTDNCPEEIAEYQPEICINFLGNLLDNGSQQLLYRIPNHTSTSTDPHLNRGFILEINVFLHNECLCFDIHYDESRLSSNWINQFCQTIQPTNQAGYLHKPIQYQPKRWINDSILQSSLSPNSQISLLERYLPAGAIKFGALGPLQEGMLFHGLTAMDDSTYTTQLVWEIHSPVNPQKFQLAWKRVVDKVEMLRTVFNYDFECPVQIVIENPYFHYEYLDFSNIPDYKKKEKVKQTLQDLRVNGFKIDSEPPSRATLIKLNNESFQFIWTHHHILIDGWSASIVRQLLEYSYSNVTLKNIPNYFDYLRYIHNLDWINLYHYWKKQLAGYQPKRLPISTHDKLQKNLVEPVFAELSKEQSKQLRATAANNGITLNTIIQATWAVICSYCKQTSDLTIGMTFSHRPREIVNIDHGIGLYLNTLPIRIGLEHNNFRDLTASLQDQIIQVINFGHISLSELGRIGNFANPSDLIDELVVFENYPNFNNNERLEISLENLTGIEKSNIGLMLVIDPKEKIHFKLNFDDNRYSYIFAQNIINGLTTLLSAIMQDMSLPLDYYLDLLCTVIPKNDDVQPQISSKIKNNITTNINFQLEKELQDHFTKVLKMEVKVTDDFFAFGGHSLLAIKLLHRLQNTYELKIPIKIIFELRTPRKIASYIDKHIKLYNTNQDEREEILL